MDLSLRSAGPFLTRSKIVGYSSSASINAELVTAAFKAAVTRKGVPKNLLFHSAYLIAAYLIAAYLIAAYLIVAYLIATVAASTTLIYLEKVLLSQD